MHMMKRESDPANASGQGAPKKPKIDAAALRAKLQKTLSTVKRLKQGTYGEVSGDAGGKQRLKQVYCAPVFSASQVKPCWLSTAATTSADLHPYNLRRALQGCFGPCRILTACMQP